MKISKEYLKRVIVEEIGKTLSEGKKVKIAVKGKKKSVEAEGVLGSEYDDYDRSSRSDESMHLKKNKKLDEYEYSDEKETKRKYQEDMSSGN